MKMYWQTKNEFL